MCGIIIIIVVTKTAKKIKTNKQKRTPSFTSTDLDTDTIRAPTVLFFFCRRCDERDSMLAVRWAERATKTRAQRASLYSQVFSVSTNKGSASGLGGHPILTQTHTQYNGWLFSATTIKILFLFAPLENFTNSHRSEVRVELFFSPLAHPSKTLQLSARWARDVPCRCSWGQSAFG